MLIYVTYVLACALLSMLALSDLRRRRLPNAMVASFAVLYFAHAWLAPEARTGLALHVATGTAALALAAALFRFGWLGGGDAKLFGAVFLWSGPAHASTVFFIVSMFGLMLALAQIVLGRFQRDDAAPLALAWLAPARGVPYGVALAAGGIVAVWLPVWLPAAHPLALPLRHASWPVLAHVRLT